MIDGTYFKRNPGGRAVRYRIPGHEEYVGPIRGGLPGVTHIVNSYPVPEGQPMTIILYDDSALHDRIGDWTGIA